MDAKAYIVNPTSKTTIVLRIFLTTEYNAEK